MAEKTKKRESGTAAKKSGASTAKTTAKAAAAAKVAPKAKAASKKEAVSDKPKVAAVKESPAKAARKDVAQIRIRYFRSAIGRSFRQKRIVQGLGLRKLNQVVERPDTPQIRGMVAKIPHLVQIVQGDES